VVRAAHNAHEKRLHGIEVPNLVVLLPEQRDILACYAAIRSFSQRFADIDYWFMPIHTLGFPK
jgi:hypothetical protein